MAQRNVPYNKKRWMCPVCRRTNLTEQNYTAHFKLKHTRFLNEEIDKPIIPYSTSEESSESDESIEADETSSHEPDLDSNTNDGSSPKPNFDNIVIKNEIHE